jgi:cation:H+ antiporter
MLLLMANVFLILFLCYVMYKSSLWLVHGINEVASDGLLSKFFLASIFAGLATSVPEIFVGITSSLERAPNIAFGNAIGSNIANIGLIFSLALLVTPLAFRVHRQDFSAKTILLLLTSALFPFLLALDGGLSRVDGLFLVSLFFVYSVFIFNKKPTQHTGFFSFLRRVEHLLEKQRVRNHLLLILGALLTLLISAHFMVQSSIFISQALGVRPFLIAMFIIAPGTSLPELFVAIATLKKKEHEVLYGDIFGSLITNANLVVGLSALVFPYRFAVYPEYLLSLLGLLTLFSLFVFFSRTKSKFEKWEALTLLSVYFIFFFLEVLL